MSDRLSLGLSILALAFLVGVTYLGLTMPQRPPGTQYTLEIETAVSGENVEARGTSNLPAGSRLMVYVDRLYRLKGSGTWRAARVGEGEALVEGGRWNATVPVVDGDWVEEVADRMNRRDIDPVEDIQSKLRTTVVFSPLVGQDASVRSALGPDFVGLSESNAVVQVGTYWVMRNEDTVEKPLTMDLERALLPQRN